MGRGAAARPGRPRRAGAEDLEGVRAAGARPAGTTGGRGRPAAGPDLGDGGGAWTAGADPRRRSGRLLRPAGRHQRALGGAARAPRLAVPQPAFPAFPDDRDAGWRTWWPAIPATTFIGAHVGCYAENLAWVGDAARPLPEFLHRHRRPHRRAGPPALRGPALLPQIRRPHLVRHSTWPPTSNAYRIYYRFLETEDEYFNYDPGRSPRQGRWSDLWPRPAGRRLAEGLPRQCR